ncbi:sensor domain-containing diguanylate cyclase [Magnetovibrio sp.]|uniref:sensor domain-containing diguanylate cyclase n=1 Tax=Magnetovibrio sp. TaxID=2024836 RepID=UPI002F93B005
MKSMTGLAPINVTIFPPADAQGEVVHAVSDAMSPEALLVSGYGEAAVVLNLQTNHAIANRHASRVASLFEGDVNAQLKQLIDMAADHAKVVTANLSLPGLSGQSIYQLNIIPKVLGEQLLFLFHDQTLDNNLRDALIESRQRFKDLVEVSSDFSWEVGDEGRFIFVSRTGALGYAADDMIGRKPEDFIVGAEEYAPIPFLSDKRIEDMEVWMYRADGGMACVVVSAIPFFEDDGTPLGVRGVCRDVTAERERAVALAHAHQREQVLGYIVNTIRDEIDPTDMLAAAAAATARAMGASGCRVLRMTVGKEIDARLEFEPAAEFGTGGPGQMGEGFLTFSKHDAWLREEEIEGWRVIAAPCQHSGEINGVICLWKRSDWSDDDRLLVNDISNQLGIAIEQIENHESIVRLSRTDAMTGLLNRRAFYDDELPRRFHRLEREGASGALFYIDMDNFKLVNDVHGHLKGDEAIMRLRDLLHDFVRPGDVIARLGGDEFALWLDNMDEEAAVARSRQLLVLSEQLRELSGDPDRPLGISIGIAVYRPDTKEDLESLLARADSAMYEVKQKSKGDCCLAAPYSLAG